MTTNKRDVVKLPHHLPSELCTTRPNYRQGKKLTAVKVYTINSESQHILVCGVPSLGLQDDLRRLCAKFGDVKSLVFVPNYAEEEFTEAYHVQFTRIQSARYAKRHMDGREFFGGILHVCYAPEMESVAETRAKLVQRRKEVAQRIRGNSSQPAQSTAPPQQYYRSKKHPALPLSVDRLTQADCVWQGVPCDVDPRTIVPARNLIESQRVYGPGRPNDEWAQAGVRERKIVSSSSHVKNSKAPVPTLKSTRSTNSSVLKFIPRQVSSRSRIVFRDKESLKRSSEHLESGDKSLHESIVEIRSKIRAVSVPSIQVILERKDPLSAAGSSPG